MTRRDTAHGSRILPDHIACHILAQIVLALEHLHCQGIVHRGLLLHLGVTSLTAFSNVFHPPDIKPENIIVTPGGHIRLIDFATAVDLNDTSGKYTQFAGTAQFLPVRLYRTLPFYRI